MAADIPDDWPVSHVPMPINADGDGPEMDPAKVTETICWECLSTWPCDGVRDDDQ